jgi:AraC-like DNA-binding protein
VTKATILSALHLTSGVFLDGEFTAPWCIAAQLAPQDCSPFGPIPRRVIAFHYVSLGSLQLQVDGESPVSVRAGELVILPRNDRHLMGSSVDVEPAIGDDLVLPGEGGMAQIRHGGGGAPTKVICGFLGTDAWNDPLLAALPRLIRLGTAEGPTVAWLDSSFRFAAGEGGRAPSATVLVRLAEVLFMDAVRRFLDALPEDRAPWDENPIDVRITRAIALLRADLRRRWTIDDLAREVGLSRSAFAAHFSQATGEPPMRWLARQRLDLAARRLTERDETLARVAFAVGYESEAAFSRAFKRAFGIAPAAWRAGERPVG